MRKPTLEDFANGDGSYDYEGYYDTMDNYADEAKDDAVEREWQEEEEKENGNG